MMTMIRVTNIQKMCFHDGPGIRTTVFLKGCSIHCPWCSNPENLSFEFEEYRDGDNLGCYGRDYAPDELFSEVMKDRAFWGEDGGVTFSGGEALLQSHSLEPLFKSLKKDGINLAAETALFISEEALELAIQYIDYFIVDVKILDKVRCLEILGGDLDLYFRNVDRLHASGRLKLFRIPLCYEYTFDETNKAKIMEFVSKYGDIPVQIFAIHNLGEKKYESLGKGQWIGEKVNEEDLNPFSGQLSDVGITNEIIRI